MIYIIIILFVGFAVHQIHHTYKKNKKDSELVVSEYQVKALNVKTLEECQNLKKELDDLTNTNNGIRGKDKAMLCVVLIYLQGKIDILTT